MSEQNDDTPPTSTSRNKIANQTNKGDHKTGIVWSYRSESERMFHGNFDSRHEAIGHAVIVGRILDEETHVRWHESRWRELDEPIVCGYCEFENWYLPLVRWTFRADCEASPFCSTECYARHVRESDAHSLRLDGGKA